MANKLNRDEVSLLTELVEKFDSDNSVAKNAAKFKQPAGQMQRQGDTVWRPAPMICTTVSGLDITTVISDVIEMQVPSVLSTISNVPFQLNVQEMRDPSYRSRKAVAGAQALSAAINRAIANVVRDQGSLVVARSAALSGYDDVALADALMVENDILGNDKTLCLGARDYNNMAGNLASRMLLTRSEKALDTTALGPIANFDTFKTSYAPRLTAAAGGGSITVNGNQRYVPAATVTNSGYISKLDNRTMNLTVSSTTNVLAGDKFTIGTGASTTDVYSVSHINKVNTGQLKTFTVKEVVSGTVLKISPPIIVGDGTSDAEDDYANCSGAALNAKAITWLNTVTVLCNPFFMNDSIEVFGGSLMFDDMPGVAVERMMTDSGVEIIFAKGGNVLTGITTYRLTIFYGVTNKDPEQNGILIGAQT